MNKIKQEDFRLLFGSFAILASYNNKSIYTTGIEKTSLEKSRDTEIERFKTLFNKLTFEQKQAVDIVEFALSGFEFESYSDFVDNHHATE